MGDEIETMRLVMGDEIETMRSAAPMSFGSRTRSVLGGSILSGDDLDGGIGAKMRSRWDDLGGTNSTTRSR